MLTELLSNQDQQICSYLEEKLHIYAELGHLSGFEEVHVEPHLLVKPDSGETPQAASLLAAALKEGEFAWEEWTGVPSHGQIIQGNKVQLCLLPCAAILSSLKNWQCQNLAKGIEEKSLKFMLVRCTRWHLPDWYKGYV